MVLEILGNLEMEMIRIYDPLYKVVDHEIQ